MEGWRTYIEPEPETGMPSNVFGTPVTYQTVQALPEYIGKKIGRKERAHVALNMKNAEGKDINARNYVENLKKQSGYGISSLCLVYSATGDTIRLVANKDWSGNIGPIPNTDCKWAVGCHFACQNQWSGYWIGCGCCISR